MRETVIKAALQALVACALTLGLVLGGLSHAMALEVEATSHPVPREILAIYDARAEGQIRETRIHKYAEMPLNYLGFSVTYWDVNSSLPPIADLKRYRGIVSWLVEPLEHADEYLAWLDLATASGLPLDVFSELAPPSPQAQAAVSKRILARLGLTPTDAYMSVTTQVRIVQANKEMVGFERAIDKALPDFPVMLASSGSATVHLGLQAPTRAGKVEAAVVTTSKSGGYVADEYSVFFEPNTDRVLWVLNPFNFFKATFGLERMPIPDVTTLSGRRLYFSQIDGDGWNNVTEIERYQAAKLLSSEVIEREVIQPYPDLPITVGVIGGDVDLSLGGVPEAIKVTQRLFALPQVEVASHTYTHPFTWSLFEAYDRAAEVKLIEDLRKTNAGFLESARAAVAGLAVSNSGAVAHTHGPLQAVSGDLPRAYMQNPFNLENDIKGGLKLAESLSPPGKRAKILLWSGNAVPFEAAIAMSRSAGVRNMNGGDSRLDRSYPSVTYVPPIGRVVGKERQIYSGNSNENTYTNDWLGPFFGFFMLDQTLDNTERPRRLKPFDLYYHMYSGQKPASLAAVKHFVDRARLSDVIPVTASTYAGLADDFYGVAIEQLDVDQWVITNRGTLTTVRFDEADELEVNWLKSDGVLGSARHEHSLYVTLDRAVERAVVTLGKRQVQDLAILRPVASTGQPQPLVLDNARWQLWGQTPEGCGLSFTAQGFGPGDMTWRTQSRRSYKLTASRNGQSLSEEILFADAQGRLDAHVGVDAIEPLTLRLECHD